ncbi:MAG: 4-amino-4-deoxy-L-arabinose-phospho-UDP flippase [Rhodoferax sp.]|jgi:drug/metabolite transporter (DMT)-like permease|nr:4-amino-4-deoxy-L-arabinose-phospho-UDP flippase [Rhodoferax sp.]
MIPYFAAVLCVVALTIGQILFKISATALTESGTLFAVKPAATLMAAFVLYGVTSAGWVWVLQQVELGRIYPLMALAFVLVPLGSHLVLGERFQTQYFVGVAMIVVGIIIATRS